MSRRSTILAFVLLLASASAQMSTYPQRKGIVSDYTGKLDQAQIEELSTLIRDYERHTSIEFAVVIPNTLQGQPAREYAERIGNAWAVGKAGRNNGIVLLWAPNERAYSLRIADGLSADVTDSDAKDITEENLLPYFKRGEYYQGLERTLLATMQKLGDAAWEERLQVRAQAGQAHRQRQISSALIFGALAAMAGLGIVAGVILYRSRQRNEKLAEMTDANLKITDSLLIAERNAPQVQQLLRNLSAEMPEQDIRSLSEEIAAQPRRIASIRTDAANLNFTDLESCEEVLKIKQKAETEAALLQATRERVTEIRRAKQQSQAAMQQLLKENFDISDVRDTARRGDVDQLLSSSRAMYDKARQDSSTSMFDWLLINEMLSSSQDHVRKAVEISQAEPYTPLPPSFDTTSTVLDTSSTLGGDTGGGGGFSSGSGSEGSY